MSNLFDYNVNLQPAVMDIRSETLEPISSSSHRYVFRLDQSGELDANSVLLFKPVLSANAADNEHHCRVNAYAGGLLAIKRATFQVGDYVLNDIHDIGRISALVDMGTINASNNSKYNGHYFKNNLQYKVLDTLGNGTNLGGTEAKYGGEGSIVVDRARSAVDYGRVENQGADDGQPNNCILTNDVNTSHQIGIPLGNLFPAIKNQTIPLFLFQDYRILITIEFHTADKYVNLVGRNDVAGARVNVASAADVVPQEVKLQVDYIIQPAEIQNKMREMTNAQGGLNLSYPDIIKVEKQIPEVSATDNAANSGLVQTVEHRIGMDNKEVHKIYMLKQKTGAQTNEDRVYMNGRCEGMNQEEYNCNIDGVDIFQESKWNPASQYDEASACLGGDLQVPRPVYFNDENTIMNKLADSSGAILGKLKPLCLDLSNGNAGVVGGGRSVGAYPIIWKYTRRPCASIASFADGNSPAVGGGAKMSQTKCSGALNVDYFVYCSRTANIQSTPQGTSVMVAY